MSKPVLWIKYTPKAFEEVFEDFNKKVRDKQYKKFDYDTWCSIRKYIKTLSSDLTQIQPIEVSFQIGFTPDVTIFIKHDIHYQFNSKDGTFGQYLWKRQAPEAVIDVIQKYGVTDCRNIFDFVIPFMPHPMEVEWKNNMTLGDNYYKNLIHKKIVEDHDSQYKVFNSAGNYNKTIGITKPWYNYNNNSVETVKHAFAVQSATYENSNAATVNKKISNTAATADILINDPTIGAYNPTATKAYTDALATSVTGSASVISGGVVSNPATGEISIDYDICNSMGCKNCKNYKKKDNEERENKMKGFNFDFGKITNDSIRMSMYGMAVKNASGVWTAYDKSAGDLMDVDVFNFDGSNFLFKMPVAIKDIAVGDVVIHARKPMFVISKTEAGDLVAIDPVAGEKKTIMPVRSPFGFNFATKIISLFDSLMPTTEAPSADNPFGSLWMLMLLDGKSDMKDMLIPMMLMSQANGSTNAFNPMMLMLMNDGDMKDMAIPLMLMNQVK